jgi:hypothetical protein
MVAFNTITAVLYEQPEFAHFYLQGAGDIGKTFLYRARYMQMYAPKI